MYDEQILVLDLQKAREGSPELDTRLARLIHPKKTVILIDGEPHFERRGKRKTYTPVPHYTRSVDAKLPRENIIRVERRGASRRFWRAWLETDWSAYGPTEAIARRLAVLTGQAILRDWDPARHRKPSRAIRRPTKSGAKDLDIHPSKNSPYLKSYHSDRRSQINPRLTELGFLDFVQERRKKNIGLVFHEMIGRRNVMDRIGPRPGTSTSGASASPTSGKCSIAFATTSSGHAVKPGSVKRFTTR